MPGMVTTYGQRIARVDADGYSVAYYRGGHLQPVAADALPDLTDPATLGCLLALVRKLHHDPRAFVTFEYGDAIFVACPEGRTTATCVCIMDSEAKALVAALEDS